MRKIELLRDLQAVDSQLDRDRQSLEQIKSKLGDDSDLVPLREQLQLAQQARKALQEKGREMDWDLEKRSSKRKADEKKLYDGSVKNPKELASLAHEVDLEREQISKLEDKVLANMEALEAASATLDAATRELGERERSWREEQASLEEQRSTLSQRISELGSRRVEITGQIDAPTLRNYESLRRTRGGLAVAFVEQRSCQGCRISLTPNQVQRARSSPDPVACHNCGRILYVPN